MGEAMTNAIKHGNEQDPARKIRVSSSLSAELLRIRITDEGSGFDPAILPDPTAPENLEATTGRGVMVMRNYMTRVEFLDPGNTVVMEKDQHQSV
jgi:serine/threonine-protein kinase RsbW